MEKLKASRTPKAPSTEQAPSTLKALEAQAKRNPIEDMAWANRPLPADWKAVPNAKSKEESVGMRNLQASEILTEETRRRRAKNSDGQATGSSTSKENRQRAQEAFIYTPAARVSRRDVELRAVGLVEYKSEPMKEVWVEMNWFQALIHRIRGNKVISTDKK